ncbi:unnamed protein product [Caenorhabditis angaria]|uniref:Uncharacterized protein n=1 Tax=Caenorhabditis angaria TaxID=860376 RepID=A0A9P1N396_9PELO|nr:unnamed protein product [Caenorhabditis angaria]
MKNIIVISIFIIILSCCKANDINPKCETNKRNVTIRNENKPTMLIFVIGFKNPQSERAAKVYYLIQQVYCSIPNVSGLDYGLILYPNTAIQSFTSSDFPNTLLKAQKNTDIANCENYKESLKNVGSQSALTNYKRVELFIVMDSDVVCDFYTEFKSKNLDSKFRFNAIRFDSKVINGTYSLNYPNIESININETNASSEVKLAAFNFIGDIFGIPRSEEEEEEVVVVEEYDGHRTVEYIVIGLIVLGFLIGAIGIFFMVRNSKRNARIKEETRVADIERRKQLEVEATKKKEAYILRLYGPRNNGVHKIDLDDLPSEQDAYDEGKLTPRPSHTETKTEIKKK